MAEGLQPLLHDELVVLRAPAQLWSGQDGGYGDAAIHGLYVSDLRVVAAQRVSVGGVEGEHIATSLDSADTVRFVRLHRGLDAPGADPDVRSTHERRIDRDGTHEQLTLESRLAAPISTRVRVVLDLDVSEFERLKSGLGASDEPIDVRTDGDTATWSRGEMTVRLEAPGAEVRLVEPRRLELEWPVEVPAHGTATVTWSVLAHDDAAVVTGAVAPAGWTVPEVSSGDERLARWVRRALSDLDALRLETVRQPGEQFLAAGAPWFFTLFGRDSIWAARFLLPLGTELAASTLRVLAGLQGNEVVADTAEQPGKIMHELRRATLNLPDEGLALPPLYYGTVDATPLWVCLLHDAWRWGMPRDEVAALLPHLRAALAWMRDFGDSDGDGLLEYVDSTGHGLSNQGWKDSGDSVQWRDGRLAKAPIALVEVQAYAFEAATHGADLLEAFGEDGTEWREWAARLKQRFDETFWISDPAGDYPAIALDADKRPVDTVTSNLGHLLGTGLLDERQSLLVARRLASPELDSGFGLRTMSTDSAGYWPLSYHGGSVWTHDTAIAIAGLSKDGHREVADALIRSLLAAASGFDYRIPELHSGDAASSVASPVPYPAACRPQAWSAAAAVTVLTSVLGAEPRTDHLLISPSTVVGALEVSGLRFHGQPVSISVNADGEVVSASGAPIEIDGPSAVRRPPAR